MHISMQHFAKLLYPSHHCLLSALAHSTCRLKLGMDRASKLRRLNEFRRTKPHCSASALQSILRDIKQHGLPDLIDRNAMREGRDLIVSSPTDYGPIIQQVPFTDCDGNAENVPVASPFASLWTAVVESKSFERFVYQCYQRKPPSPDNPWSIIMYTDEVTPGDVLAHVIARKFLAVYWSFLEFGANSLSHEESWFTIMTEFTSTVFTMPGGQSQAFNIAIKQFFPGNGFDIEKSGIRLTLQGQDVRIFAKITIVIQDGGAHKAVYGLRGDGASKFCILCSNLWTEESNITEEDGTSLLRCNVIKLHELSASSSDELRKNALYLQQEYTKRNAEEFTRLQQAIGLTYTPNGVLLEESLNDRIDPVESYMHDPMHALFSNGVVGLTIYLVFEAFIAAGHVEIYETFGAFLENWIFPRRLGTGDRLSEIFSYDRRNKHRKAQTIKCQASDLLSVMGVLLLFTRSVLRSLNTCADACLALESVIKIASLAIATTRTEVKAETLLAEVHRFLEHFTTAFGFENLIPKCHWLLHFPEALLKFGLLLNCFALERKHRIPKRYASELKNISQKATTSLLSEVACHHIESLKSFSWEFSVGLVHARSAPKKVRKYILEVLELDGQDDFDIQTALVARVSALATCHEGDFVLLRGEGANDMLAGRAKLHFAIDGIPLSMIEVFSLVRKEQNLAVWKAQADDKAECWHTSDILAAVEHCVYPDGNVGTILPIEFQ